MTTMYKATSRATVQISPEQYQTHETTQHIAEEDRDAFFKYQQAQGWAETVFSDPDDHYTGDYDGIDHEGSPYDNSFLKDYR